MTPRRWAQIEELFHRAAECDPKHRNRLLDDACTGDPQLRREVESLLSSEQTASDNLQAAVRSGLAAIAFPLVGETISHYRIVDGLGGGGMGLVYRAEDSRLGRQVALKFLPEESIKDPAALGRFEREARSASALEHPNICPIYEFGEHEGRPFLVMPLLEGHTLRELIFHAQGSNPPFEPTRLLDLAIQIAEGLDVAHRHGIIHRDIKPANIFITSEGQAKILDFGLAKLCSGEIEEIVSEQGKSAVRQQSLDAQKELSLSTPDPLLSRTGVAVGTAGYMSPEQARGEKLDARTDLFSFGLVLYEMATGQRALKGDTGPALHRAILNETPAPVRQLNPQVPSKLATIIQKALEKDRNARYQSAVELAADLKSIKLQLRSKPRVARWTTIGAGVLLLALAAIIFRLAQHQQPASGPPLQIKFRQLTINSPDNPVTSGAISPDGRYLAFVDTQGIHVKDIETSVTRSIAQPPETSKDKVKWDIVGAGWFPDNTRFLANAHPATEIHEVWSSQTTSFWMFSRTGDSPRKLRDNAVALSVSPDGTRIPFQTNRGRFGEHELWLMRLDTGQFQKLIDADENSAIDGFYWSPDGRRGLYAKVDSAGANFLIRDINGGPPTTVLTPDATRQIQGDLAWLPDGRIIYQAGDAGSSSDPKDACNFWSLRLNPGSAKPMDNPTPLTNWTGFCITNANATADGKRLAFLRSSGAHGTAYVADLLDGERRIQNPRHFTLEEGDEFIGDWTRDSRTAIVGVTWTDGWGLYKQSLNSGAPEPLVPRVPGGLLSEAILSPDDRWVLALIWPVSPDGSAANPTFRQTMVRIPIAGGTPQPIFQVVRAGPYSCAKAPSNLCVLPEQTADHKQLVVTAFDPVKGRGRELIRFDLARDINLDVENLLCVLSPDGTRLALARSQDGPIEIWSLRGYRLLTIQAKELDKIWNLQWAADSKGLFVPKHVQDGTELLHVDMRGKTMRLWKSLGPRCFGVPSPNGRQLAIYDWQRSANMWLMENF